MKKTRKKHSFRFVLSVGMLICWLLPIVIIGLSAGVMLNRYYSQNLYRTTQADVNSAVQMLEIRMNSVIEDSKAVSYDGIVRQAYRDYRTGEETSRVYRTISDYLMQRFSRNVLYRASFISFLDEALEILPYASSPGVSNVELLRTYTRTVLPMAKEISARQDTGIHFTVIEDRLYMVRNLLDTEFRPYAILVVELEEAELLQSLWGRNQGLTVSIDGVAIPMDDAPETGGAEVLSVSCQVDGHEIVCSARMEGLNLWTAVPMLRWIVLLVCALVIPLLGILVALFHGNINRPIEILTEANSRIRSGERGFQIQQTPPNSEFARLYRDFNAMSSELESQFRRLYEEQSALQQARVKALQSQINPHFLNNTLEIINWEARLADNERVCSMIEALSTMLDAAIGRDGRSQVLLSEELKYADAYLHITKERLGDRLTIVRQIAPETLNCRVPLLMLQPILENAVEYDLTVSGGELVLRSFLWGNVLHLEVEHDGEVSEEGWAKIRAGLDAESGAVGRSVGIRNVVNRLALIYGRDSRFDIREVRPGRILAEIILRPTPPSVLP